MYTIPLVFAFAVLVAAGTNTAFGYAVAFAATVMGMVVKSE